MYTLEVIPGVNQITVGRANIFLIAEKGLTLIDTGFRGSVPYILDTIRHLGRSPAEIEMVILTHNHLDHIGGIEELRKLYKFKVAAHKADFEESDIIPYPVGKHLGKLLKSPVLSPLRRHLMLEAKDVDIVLQAGEVLPVLGGLQVITTPGHTPGSISLYAPERKLLFVGDAINKRHVLPLKTSTTDIWESAASIRRMLELDFDILLFGHGRPITANARTWLKSRLARTITK